MSDVTIQRSTSTGFVGQEAVRRELDSIIAATRRRGEVFEHILLVGPPGFGQLDLAQTVADAMRVNIMQTSGCLIENAGQLAGTVTGLDKGDVLFIDEIDRLSPNIWEYLYTSLRRFELNIIIDQGPEARCLRLALPKFTLVAATSDQSKIDARLLACFGKVFVLDRFSLQELETVLRGRLDSLGVSINEHAVLDIAAHADGSPLVAEKLLRRVRDFSQIGGNRQIDSELVRSALSIFLPEPKEPERMRAVKSAPAASARFEEAPSNGETFDRSFEVSLRPSELNNFVGQETTREQLRIILCAAQERGDVLDHILICGQEGLGKSTLAHVIAHAIGGNIISIEAAALLDSADLCRLMSSLPRGGIFLIEDIQRLRPTLENNIRTAMKNAYVDVVSDDGPQARSHRVQLPKITIVGTAPSENAVAPSLCVDFGAAFTLYSYSEPELLCVIDRNATALNVLIEPGEALDIAKRSFGSPRRANSLLREALPRLRLTTVIAQSQWHKLPELVTNVFWGLAEARPDFEELPSWITEGEATIRNTDASQKTTTAMNVGRAIVQSLANRYGDGDDRIAITRWDSRFSNTDSHAALLLFEAVEQAKHFRKDIRQLPLAIHDDMLCVGKHARISFNRTLRIPEDGKIYPLPAGFGRLPILRVEDYAEKLPAKWVSEGGFVIPLYQREALFLEFSGVSWHPGIAKVSAGRVNAVSGKPHDLAIRNHRQDYVVIPDQQWLDGINSGDGSVKQFVAMPLGEGYTIEAQITDEEKHGGFQVVVFDSKAGRFAEKDPAKQTAAAESRKERALRAQEQEILDSFSAETRKLVKLLQGHHYVEVAELVGKTGDQVLSEIADVRSKFEAVLGSSTFDRIVPAKNLEPPDLALHAPEPLIEDRGIRFMPSIGEPSRALGAAPPFLKRPAVVKEMGIAAGGHIKQQILEDEYGADSWDSKAYRDIVIHIVNSAVFEEITGGPPPETPITMAQYQRYNIPWYSNYDEKAATVGAIGILRRILSVGQIDKQRGRNVEVDTEPARAVTEEEIRRIRVPTLEDRVNGLVKRAEQSLEARRYKIAAREASLAVDIVPTHSLPRLLRANAYLRLGYHADAEADASACLERDPTNLAALRLRALSCLGLGEILLARNDASKVLESDPGDKDALFVRAQANLDLLNYKEAFEDANRLLEHDSSNAQALRIKAKARTKLSPDVQLAIPPERAPAFAALARQIIEEGVDTPERMAAFIDEAIGTKGRPFSQALWDAIATVKPELRGTHDWSAIYSRASAGPLVQARP